jgi:hypothetical protein
MSRQPKIIPPIKGGFQGIINKVAAGHGVKQIQNQPRPKNVESPRPAAPKKP